MNADEAQKCLNVAIRAINELNFDKAERFLEKSIKLHETNEAQTLLQRLDKIRASQKKQASAEEPPVKKRVVPEPEPKKFTPEEAKIATDVLQCKDYYQMLGITKQATEAELKKAYKKKCLKVHPDKNNSPQADEAFKRINQAMTCLSDAKKRRQYNMHANSDAYEESESRGGGGGRNHPRNGGFNRGGSNFGPDDFAFHFRRE